MQRHKNKMFLVFQLNVRNRYKFASEYFTVKKLDDVTSHLMIRKLNKTLTP
jgi:hypothetical protein